MLFCREEAGSSVLGGMRGFKGTQQLSSVYHPPHSKIYLSYKSVSVISLTQKKKKKDLRFLLHKEDSKYQRKDELT